MKVKKIFEPQPEKMGFRGDKVLWKKLSELEIDGDVLSGIKREIEFYTGTLTTDKKEIYVEELCTESGMSDGFVSITWWNEIGLPLLEKRLLEVNK